MLNELWSELRYRCRALVRRTRMERELDEELRFHLERETEKYVRAGLSPDDAMRRARLAFGGIDAAKEKSRDARGTAWLEAVVQDLRYAARSLRQHGAFSSAVILTLALGIGANVTIFSLVDALLLRSLPVPHREQLVTIGDPAAVNSRWTGSPTTDYVSYPLYTDVRERNRVLSGVYANGWIEPDVRIGADASGAPEHPATRLVSGNFFNVLEIGAYAGRTFTDADDIPSSPAPVAVISDAYWQRRFAGARAVIGRAVRVDDVPVTIIGVAPPGFSGDIVGEPTDLWMPVTLESVLLPRSNFINAREVSWLVLMGRLAPGVTIQQARAVLPMLEAQSVRAHVSGIQLSRFDEDFKASPPRVEPGARGFSAHREVYGSALVVMMAAVVLVILVVCANVSNLVLARAVARLREATVRMTLGASRGRLIQQLLTESMLLALAGAAVGLVAAMWGSRLLLAVVHGDPPIVLDVTLNATVLAFTAGSALACVMLFGLVPAFRVARVDLASSLRAQGRGLPGASARVGRVSIPRLLVIAQIALSTVLLLGSSLLVRSMRELLHTDLGMDGDHLLLVHVATSRTTYAGTRLLAFRRALVDRVRRLPGVVAVSYSWGGPFSGGNSAGHVTIPDLPARPDSEGEVAIEYVGPEYFRALGAHLLRGRDLASSDMTQPARVAAIDATMAKFYFGNHDPIGRLVALDGDTYAVVGVVHDVQYRDVRARPARILFVPDADTTSKPRSFELQVHVQGDPAGFVETVRQALLAADATVPVEITTLTDRVRASISEDTLLTEVTSFFGVVALLLAAVGIYGVTAYATTQRTGEFGLRAALGAERWQVAGLVLRESAVVAVLGVAIGVPIGIATTRLLRNALFGVSPLDLPSLSIAIATLVLTALVASYIPAWRASRVSPLEALRG